MASPTSATQSTGDARVLRGASTLNRLGALDALFLHVEDGTSHMHIGSCAVFAGPPPALDELTRLIDSKLHLVPRFRQTVRFVPGGLGQPVWIDDARFDLSFHVRRCAVPAPGGRRELDLLMGQLMSQELDRDRPLWEMWVVEGLESGRWGMISKVHHCMVDGVSGTDLMVALTDVTADAVTAAPQPWTPEPAPSNTLLVADALAELAFIPGRQMVALMRGVQTPSQFLARLAGTAQGLRAFGRRLLSPAGPLSIEGPIGRQRRWTTASAGLDDAKRIRAALGGSVNDVVLAAIAGAFRALLIHRGEEVDGASLTSLVPVSVRADDDRTFNNQVSMMIAELPIGVADPLERLAAVREHMAELKGSHEPEAGAAIVEAVGMMPPALFALATRASMAVLRRSSQRSINTVTTNVPGPRIPLFALGREMLEYLPFVPLSYGVRIGIAILSYNGRISFGITGDYDSAPDVNLMADGIDAAFSELLDLASRHTMRSAS